MRTFIAILIALGCIVGVVYVAGRTQPEEHMVTQSAIIAAAPEAVWIRINDVADEPKWRKSVKSVLMEAPVDGQSCYTENLGLSLKLCVLRIDGHRLRMVSVTDAKQQFTGMWTLLVQPGDATQPYGNTTRLTITENAAIHPAFWRGVMMLTGMDRNVKQYLKDMSRSFSGRPEQS